jgi:hypothetical protein
MRVVAVAGRRVDALGAEPSRFPARNIALVEQAVSQLLGDLVAEAVVTSAANGADLICAKWAMQHEVSLHVVLPFDVDEFKRRSVTDRPGDWGALYDRAIEYARQRGTLHLLGAQTDDESAAYLRANSAILDEAAGDGNEPHALIVWDGNEREHNDFTVAFADEAKRRGIPVRAVMTNL